MLPGTLPGGGKGDVATAVVSVDDAVRVPVPSLPSGTIPLPGVGAKITLGRDRNTSDVTLEHPQVSRRHARIERKTETTVVLVDLGSTNGTLVDGVRVRGAVPLRVGAVVQVGPFKLQVVGDALVTYDQRGAMRLDALGVGRTVGRGARGRTLVRPAWLTCEPRELVAILGGSGAGKSTLLGVLAGSSRADTGRVLVNGDLVEPGAEVWRSSVGYVPQEDILHGVLSVGRALGYSARLRLPADTSRSEVTRRVDRALEAVSMTAHRATRIMDLSGGQRRRVSIAAELLAEPSLFFLDEPTSGLDPGLEKRLLANLRTIADGGRTVVVATHAAGSVGLFDLVVLMSDGWVVYVGPPAEAYGYFNVTQGDFAGVYNRIEGAPPDETVSEQARWAHEHPGETVTSAGLWAMRFRASKQHQRYVSARQGALGDAGVVSVRAATGTSRVSRARQFRLLFARDLDLLRADRRNLGLLLLQAPVIAGLLALVAPVHSLAGQAATAPDALRVLLMLATASTWFGILNAAREIARDGPIYRRERLAALRIAPYVLARFSTLAIVTVVQSAVLIGVVSLTLDVPYHGVLMLGGFELLVTSLLAALSGLALGLLISAAAATPEKATSAVPFAVIPQVLFAGTIFRVTGASSVLSWLTASRWAVRSYGATVDVNSLPTGPGLPSQTALHMADAAYTSDAAHLVMGWSALAIQTAVCIALTMAVLRARDER